MSPGTPAVREQWIDISVGLHDGMMHWPDNPPVQIGLVLVIDQGAVSNVSKRSKGVHSGTHMDAPLHFFRDGKGIDDMPLEAAMGRARVIEIDDTEPIKVAELEPHRIEPGERLLFKTINSTHSWQTDAFEKHFVFLSKEAAEGGRGVLSKGADTNRRHRLSLRRGLFQRWPRNPPRLARCGDLDYRRTQPRSSHSG